MEARSTTLQVSFILSIVFLLSLVSTHALAQEADPESIVCNNEVNVEWATITDRDNDWYLDRFYTFTSEACAGEHQTVTIEDENGDPIYQQTTFLQSDGSGTFENVNLRVEDVWQVRILLVGDSEHVEVIPAPTVDDEEESTTSSPVREVTRNLPITGMNAFIALLIGLCLALAGNQLRMYAKEK